MDKIDWLHLLLGALALAALAAPFVRSKLAPHGHASNLVAVFIEGMEASKRPGADVASVVREVMASPELHEEAVAFWQRVAPKRG